MKTVLQAVLGKWSNLGYELTEDSHFAYLTFKDSDVAVFTIHATVDSLRDACKSHWERMNG